MKKLLMAGAAALLVLTAQPLAAAEDDPVVATVNGKERHRSDVAASARGLPEQYQQQIDVIFPALVERLIGLELLAEAGRAQKLADDAEVKELMRAYEDEAIRRVYIRRLIETGVTDAELKKRYDEYVANHPPQTEIRARHILVKTKEEAEAVIAELGKGADFAELAKQKSTDPAAANGGDLGYFLPEEMVKPFADAAMALEKGAYSKTPVETEFGWHVIKLEDKRERKAPTFDEMKDELRSQVSQDLVNKKVEELRAAAKIEMFNPDGSPMQPQAPANPPAQ
jgi:peptidyl-prolyl cis-trans isomerase C